MMVPGTIVWASWPLIVGCVVAWQIRRRATFPQILGAVFFGTYGLWICSVAFFPLPHRVSAGTGWPVLLRSINLVPVREVIRTLPTLTSAQIVREFGGNLLLLVPFTLFGPMLWPSLRSWRWPLGVGLGVSVGIELLQLGLSEVVGHGYRSTDIDDVLINTAGAFLGYAVFLALAKIVGRWSPRQG